MIHRKKIKLLLLTAFFLLGFDLWLTLVHILPEFSLNFVQAKKLNSEVKVVNLKTKPIDLKGNAEVFLFNQLYWLPQDAYITKFKPKVVGASAELVFHHALIAAVGGHDTVCSEYSKVIYASGAELGEFELPKGYGYRVQGFNKFLYIEAHFKNITDKSFENVYFEYEIEYKTIPQKEVDIVRLDVVCSHLPQFVVEPMSLQLQDSKLTYTASENGRILLTGAHLHHFGDYAQLLLNGSGVVTLPSVHNEQVGHTIPPQTTNVDFRKGDVFGLRYQYTNTSGLPIDAMAIIFFAYEKVDD